MMSQINHPGFSCWNCGIDLADLPTPISRHDHCPKCFEALHNCRSCRHYAPKASVTCSEDQADPPSNKETANFCEWFRPDAGAFSGDRTGRADKAKDRLQALFGAEDETASPDESGEATPPESLSREDQARSRLDDLFRKD